MISLVAGQPGAGSMTSCVAWLFLANCFRSTTDVGGAKPDGLPAQRGFAVFVPQKDQRGTNHQQLTTKNTTPGFLLLV